MSECLVFKERLVGKGDNWLEVCNVYVMCDKIGMSKHTGYRNVLTFWKHWCLTKISRLISL